MKLFGLTGNIGCGKSTVASLLSTYPDITVLDCDTIAKEIILSGKYKEEINSILGEDVFPAGAPDTKRMAEIIFTDAKKKGRIESLIHPLVVQAVRAKAKTIPDGNICVVESALIYETQWEKEFSAVIVVSCHRGEQFRRLRERGMHINDITVRLANQMPSSEKEARAAIIIRTDFPIEDLGKKVHELYEKLHDSA